MLHFDIKPLDSALEKELQQKIDLKTKPIGALGTLEKLALQIGLIQQSSSPKLKNPHLAVFAADHGIAKEGLVNPYPQEVTFQMVMNFLSGGAAVNVLAKQNQLTVKVIDAGVNHDFGDLTALIDAKIAKGTQNFLYGPAMSASQAAEGLKKGAEIVEKIEASGCNVLGFGEMGIGNTSSAALIMRLICDLPLEDCVGRGTGANEEQLKTKIQTLRQVLAKHSKVDKKDVMEVLSTFGGFEIAQICGGMLKAAEKRMLVLVDGFISTAALLLAHKINPEILSYCIFTHCSGEKGHKSMLEYLKATPLLNLGMRLGEGSGVAVAYPVVQSACTFLNEMASFESAGVSQANDS
ncbi:hypothetical protein GCM10028791_32650 [Echinicola sediminis]